MSHPSVSYWAPLSTSTATIASLQTYAANVPLILNANTGGYSNPPVSMVSQPLVPNSPLVDNTQANLTSQGNASYNGSFWMPGVYRRIAITSGNNVSTTHFLITGMGFTAAALGVGPIPPLRLITENLVGPNASVVYSTNVWSRIDSIVPLSDPSSPTDTVSIGYGNSGMTTYHLMDNNVISWNASVQTQIVTGAGVTYSLFCSLTNPWITDPKSGQLNYPTDGVPVFALPTFTAGSTVNQIGAVTSPYRCIWAFLADGVASATSFYLTTLQQGIRS